MTETSARFTDRVGDYVLHRPSYPADAIDFVVHTLALHADDAIADLGSGTGISALPFLDRGIRVHAVEPNATMRGAAENLLGAHDRFCSHAGTAEATGLPDASVDGIIAAQAFHWFDAARAHDEARRILRPSGRTANAALIWNARREGGSPFLEGYEHLLLEGAVDYARVRHQNVAASDAVERFFGRPAKKWSTRNAQRFDWEGLRGRASSSSYVPSVGHAAHDAFYAELRALFDRTSESGAVVFEYDVDVFYQRID